MIEKASDKIADIYFFDKLMRTNRLKYGMGSYLSNV